MTAIASPTSAAGPPGSRQLWIRDRDQLHARPLSGTDGANGLSWSPDGQQVAFMVFPGILKVVSVDGAPPTVVADTLVSPGGTAWGPDGTLYSAGGFRSAGGGVVKVPATGGVPIVITNLDTTRLEFAHLSPAVLPNNRGLVFSVWYGPTRPNDTDIAVLDFKTGTYQILQRGLRARYLADWAPAHRPGRRDTHRGAVRSGQAEADRRGGAGDRRRGDPGRVLRGL